MPADDLPAPEPAAAPPATLAIQDRVAVLRLDAPGRPVNTLSTRLMRWFEAQLPRLEQGDLRGAIVVSGKRDGFVAGADIEELLGFSDPAAIRELLRSGHALMARIAALPCPTVAAIHGACLGGGLELALACSLRVATDHPKTKLGLPEVQLGLIPGMGGTQRLPRLVGVPDALDLVLTGRQLDARRALRLGLVDEVCDPTRLEAAALALLTGERRPRPVRRPLAARATRFAARLPLARNLVYDRARQDVLAKTHGHYPAPLRAIEVVREGMGLPLDSALEVEAAAFAELVVTPVAKNLMSIFFAKTDVEGRAKATARDAAPLDRAAVLGAGFMGAGIAQVLAAKGYGVVLKDRDLESVARGMKFCGERFAEMEKRRRLTPVEAQKAMARLAPTADYEAFRGMRFVVEAVFEDLAVKHAVLREVEAVAPDDLVFASNTSTIPIARIAEASRRPESVVGMHFFSPVHKMPLLEVIRHPGTSPRALATTVEVGRRMGKTVIVVGDGPGFLTSRILAPFLNEAAWCLAEGARVEQVDHALAAWGWPVGPLTLLDEVGLDIAAHAGTVMREHLGERLQPPPVFERMLGERRIGRKAGRGFYTYGDPPHDARRDRAAKPKQVDREVYALLGWSERPLREEEIAERCWLQMLNEVAYTMADGVVENPVDVDIAVVFGFGFPPFRGGILREADRVGLATIVERLDRYAERLGPRLAPAPLLRDMARSGERFHRDAGRPRR